MNEDDLDILISDYDIRKFKTELKAYKKALLYYRLSYIFPFLKVLLKTDSGFCRYFSKRRGQMIALYLVYPTLEELKPRIFFGTPGYWFEEGRVKPRIKLLKQAIKICEKTITNKTT